MQCLRLILLEDPAWDWYGLKSCDKIDFDRHVRLDDNKTRRMTLNETRGNDKMWSAENTGEETIGSVKWMAFLVISSTQG